MIRLACLFVLLTTPALAQQPPPDPATLQRAIAAIQAQRNQALDQAASIQIEAQRQDESRQVEVKRLSDEITALKAEIEKLKKAKGE